MPLRETVIELSNYYENVIKAIAVPVQKSVWVRQWNVSSEWNQKPKKVRPVPQLCLRYIWSFTSSSLYSSWTTLESPQLKSILIRTRGVRYAVIWYIDIFQNILEPEIRCYKKIIVKLSNSCFQQNSFYKYLGFLQYIKHP